MTEPKQQQRNDKTIDPYEKKCLKLFLVVFIQIDQSINQSIHKSYTHIVQIDVCVQGLPRVSFHLNGMEKEKKMRLKT